MTDPMPSMQSISPWAIAAVSLAVLAVVVVLALGLAPWRRRRRSAQPLPSEWTLTPRPVFSRDERRLFRQLREALPHHMLLAKLPLVRLCQPTDPREVRYWYRLLGAVNVTFAVCNDDGQVLAVVDLDADRDPSGRALQIKRSVLAACQVRYLRCSADRLPSIPELQLLVPQVDGATLRPTFLRPDTALEQGPLAFGPPGAFDVLHVDLSTLEGQAGFEDIGGIVVDTPAPTQRH